MSKLFGLSDLTVDILSGIFITSDVCLKVAQRILGAISDPYDPCKELGVLFDTIDADLDPTLINWGIELDGDDVEDVNVYIQATKERQAQGIRNYILTEAFSKSDVDLMRVMLRCGADPNHAQLCGDTFLHNMFACIMTADGSTNELSNIGRKVFNVLIEFGADPNARDCDNDTPLHYMFQTHTTPTVDMAWWLLSAGADPSLKNNDEFSALDFIQRRKESLARSNKCARGFIRYSPGDWHWTREVCWQAARLVENWRPLDPNRIMPYGDTTLVDVINKNYLWLFREMLPRANLNLQNKLTSTTALHTAVSKKRDVMLKALLETERVDDSLLDWQKRTALDIAVCQLKNLTTRGRVPKTAHEHRADEDRVVMLYRYSQRHEVGSPIWMDHIIHFRGSCLDHPLLEPPTDENRERLMEALMAEGFDSPNAPEKDEPRDAYLRKVDEWIRKVQCNVNSNLLNPLLHPVDDENREFLAQRFSLVGDDLDLEQLDIEIKRIQNLLRVRNHDEQQNVLVKCYIEYARRA